MPDSYHDPHQTSRDGHPPRTPHLVPPQSPRTNPLDVCFNCFDHGHYARFCPSSVCRECGHLGHIARDCDNCRRCGKPDHHQSTCQQSVLEYCTVCGKANAHFASRCPYETQKYRDYMAGEAEYEDNLRREEKKSADELGFDLPENGSAQSKPQICPLNLTKSLDLDDLTTGLKPPRSLADARVAFQVFAIEARIAVLTTEKGDWLAVDWRTAIQWPIDDERWANLE